ncbi:MAG: DUF6445 family protein, partial [Steroidobacter sp.]
RQSGSSAAGVSRDFLMLSAHTKTEPMEYDFGVNPQLTIRTVAVGHEQRPVIVIDDLMRDPQSLVNFAAMAGGFRRLKHDANYYPGVRAQVPQPYLASLYNAIKPLMRDTFGFPVDGPVKANCSFSIATLPPERLNPFQRLAHFDSADSRQLAVLHYLCDPSHGGTAFYRHRETGFESITEERAASYLETLRRDIEINGPPPAQYLTGSDSRFEQIASFDASFNRTLIYRSQMLHSGSVNGACGFSDDPRTGRLTANAFFYVPSPG